METTIRINASRCKGCNRCARKCPAGAISGAFLKPHVIDAQKCVQCGSCVERCKLGAIIKM